MDSPRTGERPVVRRARLLSELENAPTNTVLLVAPAGYGKTTLLQQWLGHAGGVRWTATPAACDLAVLAHDLTSAIGELTELDVGRVEATLRLSETSSSQGSLVAKAVLSQIRTPVEHWLAIDDYHTLMSSRAAEEAIGALEASGNFKLLIASRDRPTWSTARRFVHLEILELGAPDLAFDDDEVGVLLPSSSRSGRIRDQARGWPAVIALAARTEAPDVAITEATLAESLYDYFAEELFERTAPEVQTLLVRLALLPALSPDEVERARSRDLIGSAVATGLVHSAGGRLEVHPLARSFLLSKAQSRPDLLDFNPTGFRAGP